MSLLRIVVSAAIVCVIVLGIFAAGSYLGFWAGELLP